MPKIMDCKLDLHQKQANILVPWTRASRKASLSDPRSKLCGGPAKQQARGLADDKDRQ
jgi:hypothetical protein